MEIILNVFEFWEGSFFFGMLLFEICCLLNLWINKGKIGFYCGSLLVDVGYSILFVYR